MSKRTAQILAALAVGLLVAAVLRAVFASGEIRKMSPTLTGAVFERELPARPAQLLAPWAEPEAQSAGREWIFEVFTPPIVYFDPATERFTVRPPLEPEALPVFGVSVAELARRPYRLQYAGHHGEPGSYLVEIRDVDSGRFYRGRAPQDFPKGEFALQAFQANRRRVQPANPKATPYVETYVEMEILDRRLDRVFKIRQDPLIAPFPIVVLRSESGSRSADLKAGAEWETVDGRFRLISIDEAARSAVIEKYDADGRLLDTQSLSVDETPIPSDR